MIALAEEGSFAKASKRLHLTQPALTRSIQVLEQEMGITLFNRHSAGVRLTVAGREIYTGSKNLLRSANGLRREAELIRDARQGKLALGVGPVPAQLILSDVLAKIMVDNCAIQIHVEVKPYIQLLEQLLDETIEFFISNTSELAACPDIVIEPLTELSLGLYVREGHPLRDSGCMNRAQLYEYPLACHGVSEQLPLNPLHNEVPLLNQWPGRLSCENILVLKSVVLQTDAILMTAEDLVADELQSSTLVPLDNAVMGKKYKTELGVVQLANRSLSPLADRLISNIKKQIEKQFKGG